MHQLNGVFRPDPTPRDLSLAAGLARHAANQVPPCGPPQAPPRAATSGDLPVTLEDIEEQFDNLPDTIPNPVGHKLAVLLLLPPERVGSVMISDDIRDRHGLASQYGIVLALGPGAYQDAARFPTGPWCQMGDIVVIRRYAGDALRLPPRRPGCELRLAFLNDDEILAVSDTKLGGGRVAAGSHDAPPPAMQAEPAGGDASRPDDEAGAQPVARAPMGSAR